MAYAEADRKYVVGVFPEIDRIEPPELRAKVVEIWVDAWRASSWDRIEDVPKNPTDESPLYLHVRSVVELASVSAEALARAQGTAYDPDLLLAAGLLHDVSKLVEMERDATGAIVLTPIGRLIQHGVWTANACLQKGLSLELAHTIIAHTNASGTRPVSVEGVILRSTDFLDTDVAKVANASGRPA